METLSVARYEVQGNDFLIALVNEGELRSLDRALGALGLDRARLAIAICDRASGAGSRPGYHHSCGADGFVIGVDRRPDDCTRMHLLNSDGSFAETSGNGLACLAQAAFDAGVVTSGRLEFETDAGRQSCDIGDVAAARSSNPDFAAAEASRSVGVQMRSVTVGPEISEDLAARIQNDLGDELLRFGTGDVGNPHLVIALRGPIDTIRTAELGAAYEKHFSSGINVEFIWASADAQASTEHRPVVMSVWERGAGLTLSCGTGSVVAATFAHEWEIANYGATVRMETAHMSAPFSYSVRTGSLPQLCVMAERIETDISVRLDDLKDLS